MAKRETDLTVKGLEMFLVEEFEQRHINKYYEDETFEYALNFTLITHDEEKNICDIICGIEVDGIDVVVFPIGRNYTTNGAKRKMSQIMNMIEGSRLIQRTLEEKTNGDTLRSWGWELKTESELIEEGFCDEEEQEEKNLVDCYKCNSKGGVLEEVDSAFGAELWDTCYYCEGTGKAKALEEYEMKLYSSHLEYERVLGGYVAEEIVNCEWDDEMRCGYIVVDTDILKDIED